MFFSCRSGYDKRIEQRACTNLKDPERCVQEPIQADGRRTSNRAPPVGLSLTATVPTVGFDDFARERQPQAGATVVSRPRFIEAHESVKDHPLVLGGDPIAVIVDLQDRRAILGCKTHLYLGVGVADRVGQQVHDHPLVLIGRPPNRGSTYPGNVD